jgi:cytochrome c biogenesis protein CcmG/thiol:disulfide interchange protein DsbE
MSPSTPLSHRIQHNPGELKTSGLASDYATLVGHGTPPARATPARGAFPGHGQISALMSARRTLVTLACIALLALLALGLSELPRGASTDGSVARLTRAQVDALLAGSPPPLRALHAESGRLLGGGARALRARLLALKGYPVVINKWASWCEPCQAESPAFERVSAEYGRRVAFLGIDSRDPSHAGPVAFLSRFPLSYPSYYDRSGALGEQVTDSSGTPVTVFIARDGRQFIWQGQFPSAAKLAQDVRRYALEA